MFHIEFMILYLLEIIFAAVILSAAYLLFWSVITIADRIRKLIRKGGEENGTGERICRTGKGGSE